MNDVIGAGLYLNNRPDVQPGRIAVWGGSYGGYLTAMALSRASELFSAGVDFHGVPDWSSLRDFAAPVGGDPKEERDYQEALRVAFESSPMASVDTWRPLSYSYLATMTPISLLLSLPYWPPICGSAMWNSKNSYCQTK